MAELSRTTGVPVPTIKYYLREGLLTPGEQAGRNQVYYDDRHVRRIKMVRALAEYGGLSIAVIRELLAYIDHPGRDPLRLLGEAQATVIPRYERRDAPEEERGRRRLAEVIAKRGWKNVGDHPSFDAAAGVIGVLEQLGRQDVIEALDDFAAAAELIAVTDLRVVGDARDVERAVQVVILGTVLGDALLAALRRLAQSHVAYELETGDRTL
ncbi:MerR family transcriptional regulator [Sinosporangium siamense]|nr:MerR family transcriptional regulator [Sinosporangium siamense]